MNNKALRNGILAGGSWIVDHIKLVDFFPEQDGLAFILYQAYNTGGSPYNILKGLSRMGAPFKLSGIGIVGDDSNGVYILDDCIKNNIDKRMIKVQLGGFTSFTDVVTEKPTGRRTFLHHKGVNTLLNPSHFRLEKFKYKIFHLGYLLQLDALDRLDANGRTGASYLFEKAQEIGFKTSSDMISLKTGDYQAVVRPSLPFLNYLFVNTFEASRILGRPYQRLDTGLADLEDMRQMGRELLDLGVQEWVIIEFKEGCMAVGKSGEVHVQGKPILGPEEMVSAAGVGEALAASLLWGFHEGWDIRDALRFAAATAGCCMRHISCTEGIPRYDEVLQLGQNWQYHRFEEMPA